ncbi:MAG: winged helix-turn-helix domain-containing protein [Anaerolineae bacterium]|nr:winged helix-turn-helix domain-containing protein [Anaerolineae bacterium]
METDRLIINILGPLELTLKGHPVTVVTATAARALLAYTVLHAGKALTRESLADMFWPDQPRDKALHSMRQALTQLRRGLDNETASPPFLEITRDTVQFDPHSEYACDVLTFDQIVKQVDAQQEFHRLRRGVGQPRAAYACTAMTQQLETAVNLYRGTFLDGIYVDSLQFDEWVAVNRERYHRQVLSLLFLLAEAYELRGDYRTAQLYARRQIQMEPWHEEAHQQLIRTLALDGQRTAAIAQFRECERILRDELRAPSAPQTVDLYKAILAGKLQPASLPVHTLHNLPTPRTPLIGRTETLNQTVAQLLDKTNPIVTLTGPSGVGKTRLAIAVGEAVAGCFPDGIWFIPLGYTAEESAPTPTSDQARQLICHAIAQALRFRLTPGANSAAQLQNYLREKALLLILDGMDPLSDHSGVIAEIIPHSPTVKVLATAQKRLNLRAERVISLGGLPVPPTPETPGAREFPSVRLFVERAQQLTGEFALTAENLPGVVGLCQVVEGVPLAIEMATTWVAHYSPEQIARAIRQDLHQLAPEFGDVPERHRSIQALYKEAWQRLTPDQQQTLAFASMFQGSFDEETALEVLETTPAQLTSLVERNLLIHSEERYSFSGLLKQFAASMLQGFSEEQRAELRTRHAHYYLGKVARHTTALRGPKSPDIVAALRTDLGNIREAWSWATAQGDIATVASAVEALADFFMLGNLYEEGETSFSVASWRIKDGSTPSSISSAMVRPLFVILQLQQARFHHMCGHADQARALLPRALALAERLDDRLLLAHVHHQWGKIVEGVETYLAVEAHLQRALALAIQVVTEKPESENTYRARRLIAECRERLSLVALMRGRYDRAQEGLDEALALYNANNDYLGEGRVLNSLALLALQTGHLDRAGKLLDRVLEHAETIGDQRNAALARQRLGDISCLLANFEVARQQYALALDAFRDLGIRREQAAVLTALSRLSERRQHYEEARYFAMKALQTARQVADRQIEATAWVLMGHAQYGMNQYVEAEEAYQTAVKLYEALGQYNLIQIPLAGLVDIALARDELQTARQLVERLLQDLDFGRMDCFLRPLRIALTCIQALETAGDSRSADLLQQAWETLRVRAEAIETPALRQTFLERVPEHRELRRRFRR